MDKPSPGKASGAAPRLAAAQALAAVLDRHHTLDEALGDVFGKHRLDEADRRLVHAICGFVFRNMGTIDVNLLRIMNRKRDPSPKMLHYLLKVGLAQILYMEIAPHAAVHATVEATRFMHLSKQKSLVNAVLRSAQRQKDVILSEPVQPLQTLPAWLRDRWARHYGENAVNAYLSTAMTEAPVDLSIKDPHASLEWAQKLGGEVLYPGTVRLRQTVGQLTSWDGFATGEWWVQDAAASLPVNMLGDVAGKSVLDMCAAPGGKTMQLAARGARVTALDADPARLARLTENLERVGLAHHVTTLAADARHWGAADLFDIILCDAPCTSTGTLRRHPELPWIHKEDQLVKTRQMQNDLLRQAAKLLRPGGVLLYCTCSMEPEEGEAQIKSFLNQYSDFKEVKGVPEAVQPFLKQGFNDRGWRTVPGDSGLDGGLDGFFIALLQKQ